MFALDYDGVIADTNSLKARWIQEHLDIEIPSYRCDRTECVPLIGESHYNAMSDAVYGSEGSWLAAPVPGVADALAILAESGPVYLLSARTEKRLTYVRDWLEEHRLTDFFSDMFSSSQTQKLEVASGLGCRVLVDDDMRHLIPQCESVAGVLLKAGLTETIPTPEWLELATSWDHATGFALARAKGQT